MNVTKTISHSFSSDFTSLSKCDCGPVLSTATKNLNFVLQKRPFLRNIDILSAVMQFSHPLNKVDNKCEM